MSAAAIRLVELDTDASVIEAASKRVHLALLHGSLIAHGATICFYLHRAQAIGERIRRELSHAEIETAEDRAVMKEVAANLGQASRAFERAFEEAEVTGIAKWPIFGNQLVRQLDQLACCLDDLAETAALGASEAFAASVLNELQNTLPQRIKHHATA